MNLNRLLVIGLCTYKRPELLTRCLDSIAAAEMPEGLRSILLIADNDPLGSAESVVNNFKSRSGLSIGYEVETGHGVPFARNNILRRAKSLGATELAFLDDDEQADRMWLIRLWKHYLDSGVDVVRGFVDTEYNKDVPRWIVKGAFYRRMNHPTGTRFGSSNTGNVLFNFKKLVGEWELYFNETLGRRGGSDSDYFMRAHSRGATIEWVADSIVYEPLDTERYALSYLLKRKFRTRNSEAYFKGLSVNNRIQLFARSTWRILSGILFLPFSILFGSHVAVSNLCRIVEGAGRLLGLFGAHIGWDEYHGK